jgi:folate-binding protein YgfZ
LTNIVKYFEANFSNLKLNKDNLIEVYTDIIEEINSVKYGVGIYNRSESAVIYLKGKDVLNFLHRISTNNIKDLAPYHYVSTLFTNDKGRLIDRAALISLENEFYLVGSKYNDAALYRWINKYIITEDVQSENKTGQYLILDVVGPQAESYLTLICGKEVDDLDNNKLHKIDIDGSTAYLLKKNTGTGETLYWVISDILFTERIMVYLLSHKSVFDLSMIGEYAFDFYRVLNKVPKNPNEINDNFNPHETGLINEVSFNKGCYIGQEVIARLDTYDKVQKSLKKVQVEGIDNLKLPAELYNNSKELVGIITTIVKSDLNNHYEGLAIIRNAFNQTNEHIENLQIDSENNFIKLKVLD